MKIFKTAALLAFVLTALTFTVACGGDNPTTTSASAAEVEVDTRANPYPEEVLDVSPEADDKRLKESQDAIIEESAARPTPTLTPETPAQKDMLVDVWRAKAKPTPTPKGIKPKMPQRPGAK